MVVILTLSKLYDCRDQKRVLFYRIKDILYLETREIFQIIISNKLLPIVVIMIKLIRQIAIQRTIGRQYFVSSTALITMKIYH